MTLLLPDSALEPVLSGELMWLGGVLQRLHNQVHTEPQRQAACADRLWGHAGPFLKMFQACTLVMRRDAQTAMFLLPYIVQVIGLT